MIKESIWIFILMSIDFILTYKSLILFRICKPEEKEWYNAEKNTIIRPFLKRFGIIYGLIIGAIIFYLVVGVVLFFDILSRDIILIIIGSYIFLINNHWDNISFLKSKLKSKQEVKQNDEQKSTA